MIKYLLKKYNLRNQYFSGENNIPWICLYELVHMKCGPYWYIFYMKTVVNMTIWKV